MREAYDVILAPLVTEKTTEQMDAGNVYTFIVSNDANKIEIGNAVEKLWDVTVKDVRTMRYAGKAKRAQLGRMAKNQQLGRRASFKKAVVQLSEGDSIELYEAG
jgi:large subunit ribosomal protein L23